MKKFINEKYEEYLEDQEEYGVAIIKEIKENSARIGDIYVMHVLSIVPHKVDQGYRPA